MGALFKYLTGVAIILPAVIVLFALNMAEIFVAISGVAPATVNETARWGSERLQADAQTDYAGHGSLSPIYPARPGRELFEKPVHTVSAKRINVREALQLERFALQLYPEGARDGALPQQSLSYMEARRSKSLKVRIPIIFGHGIY
jgi:hypothetical protein